MKRNIVIIILLIILVGCKNTNLTTTVPNTTNTFPVVTTDININNPPIFNSAKDITYYIGETEPNFRKGVTAYDEEDGDLTNCIVIYYEGEIDYTKPGVYTIFYQVSDSENKPAEEIVVTLTIINK